MALAATAQTHRPANLREMMRRLDIDPAGAVLPQMCLSYFTAQHRCESCVCKQACSDWLNEAPASASAPPRFCPNADILFELQFDRLHH
jgi:Family of unknown function (DUF6455)